MRLIFLLMSLLVCVNALEPDTGPPPEEPPTFTEAMEVEEVDPDPIHDIKAGDGWYKKTKGGWVAYPAEYYDTEKPPMGAYLSAVVSEEMKNTLYGGAVVVLPALVWIFLWRRKRRKGRTKSGDLNATQLQTVLRRLDTMTALMEKVTAADGKEGATEVVDWTKRRRRV